jgi:hypothetical protein
MSFRSAVEIPSPVGSVVTGADIPAATTNLNVSNQYFGTVSLPAGTYAINSSIQRTNAALTGNMFIGILYNGTTEILNYYQDILAAGADDQVFNFCNVITLTATTSVSLWTATDTAAGQLTYLTYASGVNAPIIATKIA